MKILKKVLIIVGVLTVFMVGAVVVAIYLIESNNFKPRIETWVEHRTGFDVTLQGNIELSLYPSLRVKVGRFEVANMQGFGTAPMLTVNQASIQVKWLPLLKKSIEIDGVLLDQASLNLFINANGTTNFAARLADTNLLAGIVLQGISIRESQLIWNDYLRGEMLAVKDFNLNTDKWVAHRPIHISASGVVESNRPIKQIKFAFDSIGNIDKKYTKVSFDRTHLVLQHMYDGEMIKTNLEMPSFRLLVPEEELSLESLRLQQGDFSLSFSAHWDEILSNISGAGEVETRVGDFAELLRRNYLYSLFPFNIIENTITRFGYYYDAYGLVITDFVVESTEQPGTILQQREHFVVPLFNGW